MSSATKSLIRRNADRSRSSVRNVALLMSLLVIVPLVLTIVFALVAVLRPDRATMGIVLSVCFSLTVLVGAVAMFRSFYSQVKLSRLQTDFVSHISHELRTPLTSIRMFVETLEQKRVQSQEQADECLRLLSEETSRLSAMVERILHYARMEAGRQEFKLQPISAQRLAHDVLDAFRARHLMHPIAIVTEFDDVPVTVLADADAMTDALLNILDNAVKYTGADKHIVFRLRRNLSDVVFEVQDNGPGIPIKDRRRIFEKFYRLDNLLSRTSEGSGLGLAIVRHIVVAHGGKVAIENASGQGSVFAITLKQVQA